MADDLTTVEDHLERILASVAPLPDFPQPLMETLGLAAAEDVVAPIRLPSFDNSGMDGYAVCHRDVAAASEESPVHLPVVGDVTLGAASAQRVAPGTVLSDGQSETDGAARG